LNVGDNLQLEEKESQKEEVTHNPINLTMMYYHTHSSIIMNYEYSLGIYIIERIVDFIIRYLFRVRRCLIYDLTTRANIPEMG